MADKFDLSIDLASGLQAVLCAVEYEDLAVDAKSRNDIGVLRLITRLVNLAGVVNLLHDVELDSGRLSIRRLGVTSDFPSLLVVVFGVRGHRLGDLDFGDLDVVWEALGCVCS